MTSETENRREAGSERPDTDANDARQTDGERGAAANRNGEPEGFVDIEAAASLAQLAAENERVAALEAENADIKERLLRLAADMENLRRRTEREIKDARQYAVTGFAREMLSVADNLRRAIEVVPPHAKEGGDSGLVSLIDGVEVTERGLLAALEKHGVKKLDPEGQRFDPNFHQAMFEVPNPELPNNTVVQVVQAGYAIGERVLRPAMVGVSKGGPKQAAEARTSQQPAANGAGAPGNGAADDAA